MHKSAWQEMVFFSYGKNEDFQMKKKCKDQRSCNQNEYTKRYRILCTIGVN